VAKKKRKQPDAESVAPEVAPPIEALAPVPRLTPIAALSPLPSRDAWIDRALVLVAALVAFGRALPYPLVASWDDRRFLIDDPLVTQPSIASLRSILFEPHFEAYHPLHLLSYWIDVPWLGANGWSVRVTSLALFVGVGCAMLAWLRALGVSRFPALLATLAFVVHPVQVELVVWGTGRKDVLAELFALLAWLTHLRARSLWDGNAWASRVLFLCACLSKTSAVTLPLAMFAGDLWLARRTLKDAAIWQAPAVVVAAGLGALTIAIWSGHEMIRPTDEARTSVTLVLESASHAIETLFVPARVSPLYAFVEDAPPSAFHLALGVGVIGALAAIAWRARDTRFGQTLALAVTTFVVLYAPVSNVIPTYYEFQDRHLSMPLIGLVLGLAAVLDRERGPDFDRRTRIGVVALGLACVAPLAARTIQYEQVWSSDARLWAHATSTHPRAYYAWMKLGEVRRDEGRFDGAVDAYDHAITIRPLQRLGYGALLMTLAMRDERDEALPAPSHAEELVTWYLRDADDPDALSHDAGDAALLGYRWGALMFLARQLDLAPVSDERLEHAADVQLRLDHEWLARFYIGRMSHPPLMPRMRRFWAQERERLGMPPLEPPETDGETPSPGGESSPP
jgi:hypothetical protein